MPGNRGRFTRGHTGPPRFAAAVLAVLLGLAACAQEPGPVFRDRTAELGLELPNAAACWTELDNDGWPDLCAGGTVWRNDDGQGFRLTWSEARHRARGITA